MFTKYQKVEKSATLPSQEEEELKGKLQRLGKKSAQNLTQDERKQIFEDKTQGF